MSAIIERIRAYPEKGAAGLELEEGQLIENVGLCGDRHAHGGERQLSLFFAESRELLAINREKALCLSRFRENITIRGMTGPGAISPALEAGALLEAGNTILEITGETKRCHDECKLHEMGERCSLAGMNLFAKVRKGGIIRKGDRICKIEETI